MKRIKSKLVTMLAAAALWQPAFAQELSSVRLTDVIKSQGTGNIDLFKDLTASQMEQLRTDNAGVLVFAVDVNEAASGTEKASSQAVAIKSVRLTVGFADGSQLVYDSADDCCFSETQALLAEAPDDTRNLYYTLLGESGSSRITSNNTVQDVFDSTLKIEVADALDVTEGRSRIPFEAGKTDIHAISAMSALPSSPGFTSPRKVFHS